MRGIILPWHVVMMSLLYSTGHRAMNADLLKLCGDVFYLGDGGEAV